MHTTWGYYILEKYLRNLHSWPNPKGLRGFGVVIISTINFCWAIYPLLLQLKDFSTDSESILLHVQILFIGIISTCIFLHGLSDRKRFVQLMERFSNFKEYGVPKELESKGKILKVALKIVDISSFITCLLMLIEAMSNKTCVNDSISSNLCNFVMQFYVPFHIERWQTVLLAMYQIYTCNIIGRNGLSGVLFFTYTFELITMRLEDLSDKINEIKFVVGQKNGEELKHTIKYHQHITCLFNEATNFMNKIVIPLKISVLAIIALSGVQIALGHYFTGILLFTITITVLFTVHFTGQRIIDKSSSLSDTIYNLNWYDADVSIQKDVLNFLGATQHPLVIEVILFGGASYPGMADEVKKIYVWFNCINKFMFKKS